MLYVIIAALLALWLFGLLTHAGGSLVHLLALLAVALAVFGWVTRRGPLE